MKPGTIVTGPFFSNGDNGIGVVVRRTRALWTQVGEGFTPVRIIVGDRINGGYLNITEVPELTLRKGV